jgi:GDP-4-dehydro-6-deoxy-D-mannose reductase
VSRVLVTGASGFIGRALVEKLKSRRLEIVEVDSGSGDISDPATLERIGDAEVSRVFHLAGRTYVPDSWNDPAGFLRVNTGGTVNVVAYCRKHTIPLTYVSAYLYGQPENLPISEVSAVRPNNPYALSKFLAEQICEFYASAYGLSVTVIRPFNVYGAGQDGRFLIPSIIEQVRHSGVIHVKDLSPRRDYVYIDDLIEALIRTLGHHAGYEVYNIGTGMSLSVSEIIETIQAVAHTSKAVVCENDRRNHEIDDVVADIRKAVSELGWSPKYSFRQGIEEILNS